MDNALGDFLRARRELVTPAEVGLPASSGLRRVHGLRREEVAMLAGISVEYYVRLERGRDRSPSLSVIEALAKVLHLDTEGTTYLQSLTTPKARGRSRRPEEHVPHGLALLLQTIDMPAIVLTKYGDVLAANRAAQGLSPDMQPGVNRLRWLFTDPTGVQSHPDWPRSTAAAVAHLRAQIGADSEDQRLHSLIGELSVKSDRFRELWARHDVHTATGGEIVIHHPQAGELTLLAEKLIPTGATGLELLILHPEPGTRTAEALTDIMGLNDLPCLTGRYCAAPDPGSTHQEHKGDCPENEASCASAGLTEQDQRI